VKRTCHPIFWYLVVSLAVTRLAAQFDPVQPTGLPYHVIITAVLIDSVPAAVGTEIGIFDDTLCVGVGMVTSDSGNIDIVTWEGSSNPYLPGFTSGNPITAMLYADIYGVMMYVDTELDFDVGSGLFGSGSYSVVSITSVTGIAPDIHIDQTSLSFDPVYVGESDTLFIEIENLGNALLTIDAIYSDTDQFSVNYNSAQISAGDSLEIAIGFTATDESFFFRQHPQDYTHCQGLMIQPLLHQLPCCHQKSRFHPPPGLSP